MIKVAIIQSKVDSGGTKNLIMEYYRHIDKTKIQFDLICDSDSNSIPYDEFKKLGGTIYTITPYQNIFRHVFDLWKILKKNQYPVVHAVDNTMNVFPLAISRLCGSKVRISESLTMAHKGEFKYYIKLILKPFSKCFANYYLACGEECGKWQFGNKLFEQGKVKVFKTVINAKANAYNPQLRFATRKEFCWEDNIIYGFIGRFATQKNPLFLIDIFNEIHKKQHSAKFVLIGWGPLENSILEKIEKFKLNNYVHFLGRREDIIKFYNAFDAFILPSLYEGLPVVGLEAQSSGLSVFFSTEITKEASACEELGTYIGLDFNASEWANIIIKKTLDNIHRRKSYADILIKKGYDSEAEAKRLQEFYLNALKK